MFAEIIKCISIPFIGTVLGSACVFFIRKNLNPLFGKSMNGFAAGIMIAASVWSLIIPAIEFSETNYTFAFLPAAIGLWLGILFFFVLDKIFKHLENNSASPDGKNRHPSLPMIAVAVHNFPEGMALGVLFAALISDSSYVTLSSIYALSVGIGIQNFPEGSIISVPLYTSGTGKAKAFFLGVLSAVVETLGTVITVLAASWFIPVLPYLMCFAAGAMIYVVISELCPEKAEGEYSSVFTLMFAVGFSVMMVLDVALG